MRTTRKRGRGISNSCSQRFNLRFFSQIKLSVKWCMKIYPMVKNKARETKCLKRVLSWLQGEVAVIIHKNDLVIFFFSCGPGNSGGTCLKTRFYGIPAAKTLPNMRSQPPNYRTHKQPFHHKSESAEQQENSPQYWLCSLNKV